MSLLTLVFPVAAYLAYVAHFFLSVGYPVPYIQDEFSYLLAADTFAHLRFANPTPAAWQSFETLHVNMIPTYVSMYPPAQGVFLAIGQILAGHPWWGVVLSASLLLITAGWAFLSWFPPAWALAANLAVLSFMAGTYWTTSYWGGNVAAFGGALLLGAIGRIRIRDHLSDWALWALGCSVLVCSRPYEGGLLVLLSTAELIRIFRQRRTAPQTNRPFLRALLAGALPVASLGFAWTVAYAQASTGKPYLLPYIENARQYQIRRSFHWQRDRTPPPYRHASMERVYQGLLRKEIPLPEQYQRMFRRFVHLYGGRIVFLTGAVFAPFAWTIGFRWIAATLAAGIVAISAIPFIHPHYFAPYAVFLAACWMGGVRALASRIPPRLGYAAFGLLAALLLVQAARRISLPIETPLWAYHRQEIRERLARSGQKHLILVQYGQIHNFHEEWVYNPADFASAPVLWARWWTAEKNAELAQAYPDRKLWVLNPDSSLTLVPYEPHRNSQ